MNNNDDDDDEEEQLYERQALIDDQECDDEVDLMPTSPFGMRHRTSATKLNQISSVNNSNDGGLHELKNLNNVRKTRDLISEPNGEYTYYDIQKDDSLHSICLRYSCRVDQVKQLNGLMNDQDFYGLRRIKLPLGKLGMLQEILKSEEENASSSNNHTRSRLVNSPGSALSVSVKHNPHFKPLLDPGTSSDNLIELNKSSSIEGTQVHLSEGSNGLRTQHNHSHSLSPIRDFVSDDININIDQVDTKLLKQQNFIKSDLGQEELLGNAELLVTTGDNVVERVFEDLDYHVERARVAAETYNQRAAEITERIDSGSSNPMSASFARSRASKIPELFFCNENFGLNYKKLLVCIFFICLVIPGLFYINQTSHVEHTNSSIRISAISHVLPTMKPVDAARFVPIHEV